MYSLPNILTISRIVVIPVIFLSIYIHSTLWAVLTAILFIVAAITDYFDGYLARSRNETSAFGRLLDPIADKLLVVSALLILVANHMVLPISYIPVIVILCREVLVSGLREFLSEVKVGMPVTRLAKWKTGFQMTAISLLLLGMVPAFRFLGEILLWIAGVLTFITGYQYFQKSLDYIRKLDKQAKKEAAAPVKRQKRKLPRLNRQPRKRRLKRLRPKKLLLKKAVLKQSNRLQRRLPLIKNNGRTCIYGSGKTTYSGCR